MTIRKRAGSVLFAAAAAAAVVSLSAGTALAATTLTVKVSGGGSYVATAKSTILSDHGVNVTCTSTKSKPSSTASGKIANGTTTKAVPVKVGTAAKLTFNNCTSLLGPVNTTVKSLPYAVTVDSKTNSKGQTDGIITGIKVSVSTTGCSFMVTGSTTGYYTNKSHTLTMTPKLPITPLVKKAQLTVSGVAKGSCAGAVKNGDHPTYTSTYTLNRKITIKSS
ncbi:MAG: hypothetical protein ACLQFR_13525 [Streptosporangiaceae bacterium]